MRKLTLVFALVMIANLAHSQGCTAIRNLTGFGQFALPEANEAPVDWLVNVNSRYFHSDKTFIGTSYLDANGNPNTPLGTNNVYTTNFTITRLLKKGWSVSIDIPFMAADRSSYREHDATDPAKTQYVTRTFGLGDIRVTGYKWIFDVDKPHKGNIQVGLGLKLPTGNYRYEDYFHKDHTNPLLTVVAPVNLSIMPGDGGTGFSFELNSFYNLSSKWNLYGNAFYLSNPRDQNGVSSLFGNAPTLVQIEAGATVTSVPDAYSLRAGVNFTVNKFLFWFGARQEGIPVHDLIGGSNGVRRPGTAVSVEPGINYKYKRSIFYAFMPVAVYRNAYQSVPDQIVTSLTGTYSPSPAGTADYQIFVGVLFKIAKPTSPPASPFKLQ